MRFATRQYWNATWKGIRLPAIVNPAKHYSYFVLDNIFQAHIPKEKQSFLEIGCAPASWLVYFHRRFGLKVHGADYSKTGCASSRQNLALTGVKGKIHHSDFQHFFPSRKYDVVFSNGFLEHFDEPEAMRVLRKKYDLTSSKGFVITIVPNLNGWNGFLQRILDQKVFDTHNTHIMSLSWLAKAYKKLRLSIKYSGYCGVYNPQLIRTSSRAYTLFAYPVAEIMSRCAKLIPRIESRVFSPYIVIIGKKD